MVITALPLILHEAHLIWIIRGTFQQTQRDSALLHRLRLGHHAATNPLLSLSARPFVSEPDAFRAAHRHNAPRPTLTSPLTLAGTCVSLINLHSVRRLGELCEEIMFNKWVLFKMRANPTEACCTQLYCFCLMHEAFAAALIYLCNGCLQKHVQMLHTSFLRCHRAQLPVWVSSSLSGRGGG